MKLNKPLMILCSIGAIAAGAIAVITFDMPSLNRVVAILSINLLFGCFGVLLGGRYVTKRWPY